MDDKEQLTETERALAANPELTARIERAMTNPSSLVTRPRIERGDRLRAMLADFAAEIDLDVTAGRESWGPGTERAAQRIIDAVHPGDAARMAAAAGVVDAAAGAIEHETNTRGNREALALLDYAVSLLQRTADAEPNTPAEARTGVSDRAAAALTDLAEVRRIALNPIANSSTSHVAELLDHIEAALRGDVR